MVIISGSSYGITLLILLQLIHPLFVLAMASPTPIRTVLVSGANGKLYDTLMLCVSEYVL